VQRHLIARAPIVLMLSAALVCGGCSGSSSGGKAASGQRATPCAGPPDVLAGVYHPSRLHVLAACRTVAGEVMAISHEQDGDLHIGVDTKGALINAVNRSKLHSELLVEFMPRDGGHLPAPTVGDRISLKGAWVLDSNHGWQELHRVWSEKLAGVTYRSGPEYGGSPPGAGSSEASSRCTNNKGAPCRGYGGPVQAAGAWLKSLSSAITSRRERRALAPFAADRDAASAKAGPAASRSQFHRNRKG
jgi:hypothetical protein